MMPITRVHTQTLACLRELALLTAAKCQHALLTAAKCQHALLTAAKCQHALLTAAKCQHALLTAAKCQHAPRKAILRIARTRILTTLLHEMKRRKAAGEAPRYGLASLCVGVGQGEATLVEMA